MFAYIFPAMAHDVLLADPRLARLKAAYPGAWVCRRHEGDRWILTPPGTSVDAFGSERETFDGLTYLPPQAPTTMHDLARAVIPPHNGTVELTGGLEISVAMGLLAAHRLVMGAATPHVGDPATAFGRMAWDQYDRSRDPDQTTPSDAECMRLVFLGVQACYHITEEVWDDLAPVTSDDLSALLTAIWGGDPKAASGDDGTSPSPPPDSSPTPNSPPPKPTT